MKKKSELSFFDPKKNFSESRKKIGYRQRKDTPIGVYSKLGFMSGLEVHQQLKTEKKLFCHCPAGIYQKDGQYDAELIRHMRPTLSELGEYDGTALMEFRTRKNIIYRIANQTTCTYDVDDTPPFKLNRNALEIALEISQVLKSNIVGELHITRKQYLDGSIPAGFQRTAIVSIEGEIPLAKKKIRIIQLSIEEDSCREVSDIGHERIYTTDRLGIPLIETVTYPDMKTPDEVAEAAHYIRFLNRSTGKVRTGSGAAREDVNVSINGGARVEIKGVSHIRLIPELTHNEAFRQKSFLTIKEKLLARIKNTKKWHISHIRLENGLMKKIVPDLKHGDKSKYQLLAVNLPHFRAILSFFTQPGRVFADEISDRLKVIACIEKPNMRHSEEWEEGLIAIDFGRIRNSLKAGDEDAQIVFWALPEDIETALETIEERCQLAFAGVPNETRKALEDGTTIFERVLPGADRMYPDTDSAPIPISQELIDELGKQLPIPVVERFAQLRRWQVPVDADNFLLKRNLLPLMERIISDFEVEPKFIATLLAHRLKCLMGKIKPPSDFNRERIYNLFAFIHKSKLEREIALQMLPQAYEYPNMELESVLISTGYSRLNPEKIISQISLLRETFKQINRSKRSDAGFRWIMKELRKIAIGNMALSELAREVKAGEKS